MKAGVRSILYCREERGIDRHPSRNINNMWLFFGDISLTLTSTTL